MGFKLKKKMKKLGHKVHHGLHHANKLGAKTLSAVHKGTIISEKVLKGVDEVAKEADKLGVPGSGTIHQASSKGREALKKIQKYEELGQRALHTSKNLEKLSGSKNVNEVKHHLGNVIESGKYLHEGIKAV